MEDTEIFKKSLFLWFPKCKELDFSIPTLNSLWVRVNIKPWIGVSVSRLSAKVKILEEFQANTIGSK